MTRARQVSGGKYNARNRLLLRNAPVSQITGSSADFAFAAGRVFGAASFAGAFTCARVTTNGKATIPSADGSFRQANDNELRIGNGKGLLVEEARVNGVRKPNWLNAVPGVVTAGGVLPDNMALFASNGLATQIISVRSENGMDILRLRLFGTSNNTFYVIAIDNPGPVAAINEVWCESMYAAIVGGSMTGITNIFTDQRQTGGTGATTDVAFGPLTSVLTRQPASVRTMLTGATAVVPALYIQTFNATAIDITFDLAFPSEELGAFPLSHIVSNNAVAARGIDVVSLNSSTSFIGVSSGGLFFEWDDTVGPVGTVRYLFNYRIDGTNYFRAYINTDNKVYFDVYNANVQQCGLVSTNAIALNGRYKLAVAWENGRFAMRISGLGAQPANDVSGTPPAGTPVLSVGAANGAGASPLNAFIRRLAPFLTAPTDAALDALVAA